MGLFIFKEFQYTPLLFDLLGYIYSSYLLSLLYALNLSILWSCHFIY